jgi:hypothetical protein
MLLQEAMARSKVFVLLIISMEVFEPWKQWLADEDERRLNVLVVSLQWLVYLCEHRIELDGPGCCLSSGCDEEMNVDELVQDLLAGDAIDFDPADAYIYKISFCLFEKEELSADAWCRLMLKRKTGYVTCQQPVFIVGAF